MKIQFEFYCTECGHMIVRDEPDHECPECGGWMQSRSILTCDCKETIALDYFTNECPHCGALYNRFGQRLAPVNEWDPEDVYACFGPQ